MAARMWVRSILGGVLELVAPRRCGGCDLELPPGVVGFCEVCASLLEPAAGEQAAYLYGGPMSEAIRRLKYRGRSELAEPLGARLARACRSLAGEVDLVVPVPLHRRRLAERGFNQSALLARRVARALGVPHRPRLLRRTRDTPPQAGLDEPGRAENVRGAFVAKPIRGRVLLIDDVRTTGATLPACSEALREAGAERVHGRVLARVE